MYQSCNFGSAQVGCFVISESEGRPLNAGIDDFQDFGGVAVEPQWQLQSRDVRVSCKLLHLIAHSSGPLLISVEWRWSQVECFQLN